MPGGILMAKEKESKQGIPIQGDPNNFSGFENKCANKKGKAGK
jgi:hypothetical protein